MFGITDTVLYCCMCKDMAITTYKHKMSSRIKSGHPCSPVIVWRIVCVSCRQKISPTTSACVRPITNESINRYVAKLMNTHPHFVTIINAEGYMHVDDVMDWLSHTAEYGWLSRRKRTRTIEDFCGTLGKYETTYEFISVEEVEDEV